MAKVGFIPTESKSRKHLTMGECDIGDIIYIEENQMFALIIDQDVSESRVVYLDDGEVEYWKNQAFCRKFVGEIGFDVNDFEEFI